MRLIRARTLLAITLSLALLWTFAPFLPGAVEAKGAGISVTKVADSSNPLTGTITISNSDNKNPVTIVSIQDNYEVHYPANTAPSGCLLSAGSTDGWFSLLGTVSGAALDTYAFQFTGSPALASTSTTGVTAESVALGAGASSTWSYQTLGQVNIPSSCMTSAPNSMRNVIVVTTPNGSVLTRSASFTPILQIVTTSNATLTPTVTPTHGSGNTSTPTQTFTVTPTSTSTSAGANPCLGIYTPGFWKNWNNHFTLDQFYALLVQTPDFGPTFAAMTETDAANQAVTILSLQGYYNVRSELDAELNAAFTPTLGTDTYLPAGTTKSINSLLTQAYLDNGAGNTSPYTNGNLTSTDLSVLAYLSGGGENAAQQDCQVGPLAPTTTPTSTATSTATNTPTSTATATSTATNTATATSTVTPTATNSATATPSATPTSTSTSTPTGTPTSSPTATSTTTNTPTNTVTTTPTHGPYQFPVCPQPIVSYNHNQQVVSYVENVSSVYGLKQITFIQLFNANATVKDSGTGTVFATLTPIQTVNAPPFPTPVTVSTEFSPGVGPTDVVVVEGDVINLASDSTMSIQIMDENGGTSLCDPMVTEVIRQTGQPETQTLSNVDQSNSNVTVANGSPGLTDLQITVNGTVFDLNNLTDSESLTVDVSSAMAAGGNNTITLTATGKPGGSASVVISNS